MTSPIGQFFEIYPKERRATVPLGFCADGMVYAGGLTGADPVSGALAPDLAAQTADALARLREAVEGAGGSIDTVARAVAIVARAEDREPVYGPWDSMFPDPADRPAFKVLVAPLPTGVKVRIDALALLGARRRRVDLPGVPARDPTVTMGEWMFTSRVHGTHPSGSVSESREEEIRQAFANIEALARMAGGSAADIVQLTAFGKDASYIPAARAAFERVFPKPAGRPAFETLVSPIPPRLNVMLEAIAKRGAPMPLREVLLNPATDPSPAALRLGGVVIAPWIAGAGDGTVVATRDALRSMDLLLERAGTGRAHVARVTAFLGGVAERPNFNVPWAEWFPDMADRPPHKYLAAPLRDGQAAALQVVAVPAATRQTLEIPGLVHQDPMSMGARTGNLVTSSRIFGMRPVSRVAARDARETATVMFDNASVLLGRAGVDWSRVTQATAFIADAAHAAIVEEEWRRRIGVRRGTRLHLVETNLGGNGFPRLEVLALG